jgi:uncharacterized protein
VRFLVLHGLEGSGPGHWQTWIATRLAAAGHRLRYPDLPEAADPRPERWAAALHAELARLAAGTGELVILAHSLGSLLWLREAARVAPEHRADRVALVAPPCARSGVAAVLRFLPAGASAEALGAAATTTRVVCSDDDPYCPEGAAATWAAPLGLAVDLLPGAGHVNVETGFGPWPALEAWCVGERTTLSP